jgi:hypothetical protein
VLRGKRKDDQEQTSYFGDALESKTLDIRLHDTVKYLLCNFRWEAKSEELITSHACRSYDTCWGWAMGYPGGSFVLGL